MREAYGLSRPRRSALALLVGAVLCLTGCRGGQSVTTHSLSAPESPGPRLTDAYLTDDRDNNVAKSTFLADTKPIYFVFSAVNVARTAIRAVWFADAPMSNTQAILAEEEMVSSGSSVNGLLVDRPTSAGWRPGLYHVDIYLGGNLMHTEHYRVVAAPSELDGSGDFSPAPLPSDGATPVAGVASPLVTPIPTSPSPSERALELGFNDSYQLHTARVCHDVTFTLYINGARQGVYSVPDLTNDISVNFHRGLNTVRVNWEAAAPDRDCQLSIQLNRQHRLRTLTTMHVFRSTPDLGAENLSVIVQ